MKRILIFLTLFVISLNLIFAQNKAANNTFTLQDNGTIYVDATASGLGNGTSWTNAYTSLQSALNAATSGDEIWVAKGTYKPSQEIDSTTDTPREFAFQMINNVSIYGGFAGTETATSERANYGVGKANETILSGDIGTVDDNSDNCYQVFYHSDGTNLDSTAILDGFTITKGNANGDYPHSSGGGMYNEDSSPTVTNSTFSGNSAECSGGGMDNYYSSPTVTNSTFSDNSARYGGGMFNDDSSPTVTNSTFSGNSATSYGGGMFNDDSSSTVTNSTFSGNSARYGGGMYNDDSSPTVTNSIFWNNSASIEGNEIYNPSSFSTPTFSYCDIKGCGGSSSWDAGLGNDNGNNIDSNPMFVGSGSHPYAIVGGSPCADAGNNDANSEIYDIRGVGFARELNKNDGTTGTIDIGAYEYKFGTDPINPPIYYVDVNATTGSNNGTSWVNAYTSLQSALNAATSGVYIWVAKGTYKPSSDYGLGIASPDTARGYHFRMIDDVSIFGGFAGDETATSERANYGVGEANETILSGDIGAEGDDSDNCYHVFYHSSETNLDNTAILDGFTITKGNADDVGSLHRYGGGMYNSYSSPTVTNSTFSDNSADRGGGMSNESSSPTVINSTFSDNSTTTYGGGMYNASSGPTVTNSTFCGNNANYGGGMYNSSSSDPTVTNSTFSDNSADLSGGGMSNESSSPTVINSTFISNSADNGGGMDNYDHSSPTVTNSTFSGNSARSGGGMYNNESSSPTVINSTFCGNSTTTYGGGMYNASSGPTVTNSTFCGNSATSSGGGMYNYSSSPTVTNSTFCGNSTTSYGGGMYNGYLSSPTVTNSTFCDNSATSLGGGMYNYSSDPTVINSIFWNNSASIEGNEIYNSSSSPTFSYCDIKGCGGSGDSWEANFGIDGDNNIDFDPMFIGSGNHPYAIVGVSPCADAGNNDANSEIYDIRGVGFARKLNKDNGTIGTIDIGAYEYKFGSDPLPVELTSFIAEIIEEGILLKWETATEVNNYGFEVERAVNLRGLTNLEGFTTIGFVEGHGNCNSPKQYKYIDTEQITDSTEYRLKQIDTDGAFTYYAKTVKVGNSITSADDEALPKEFKLSQNYPNPFNPTTIINYGLKSESNVQLTVYNMLGQKVTTLVNQHQQAGNYSVNFDASNLSSGTYIYRITAGEFVSVKKLVLIK